MTEHITATVRSRLVTAEIPDGTHELIRARRIAALKNRIQEKIMLVTLTLGKHTEIDHEYEVLGVRFTSCFGNCARVHVGGKLVYHSFGDPDPRRPEGGPLWHLEAYNPMIGDWEQVLSAAMSEASRMIWDRKKSAQAEVVQSLADRFGIDVEVQPVKKVALTPMKGAGAGA